MEKKQPNVFIQFAHAIYNIKAYPSFLHTRGGKVFLYILIMTCITYLATFFIPMLSVVPAVFGLDTATVDEYVPYFEISNGEFYIEEDLIYEDPDGVLLVVAVADYTIPVDVATEALRAYDTGFVVSRELIVMKQSGGAISSYGFDTFPAFSRDDLYGIIPMIKVFVVIMYVLAFIGYLAVYLFGSLVCNLMAMLVNLFVKAPVTFGSMFKLTAYARTTPILLKMILALFFGMSLNFVIVYGIYIAYMVLALNQIKKAEALALDEAEVPPAFPQMYSDSDDDRQN